MRPSWRHVPPDRDTTPAILPFLEATRRRRGLTDAIESLALAVVAGSVSGWVAAGSMQWPLALSLSVMVAAATGIGWFVRSRRNRTAAAIARTIERLRPECRNTVVTVEELHRYPDRASGWMAERVRADASHAVTGLRTSDVVPSTRPGLFAAAAVLTAVAVALLPNARDAAVAVKEAGQSVAARTLGERARALTVTVRPPAYSGLGDRTLTDPDRIEALESSRVTLALAGGSAQVRFGTTRLGTLAAGAALDLVARESGYLAIEHATARRRSSPCRSRATGSRR